MGCRRGTNLEIMPKLAAPVPPIGSHRHGHGNSCHGCTTLVSTGCSGALPLCHRFLGQGWGRSPYGRPQVKALPLVKGRLGKRVSGISVSVVGGGLVRRRGALSIERGSESGWYNKHKCLLWPYKIRISQSYGKCSIEAHTGSSRSSELAN